VFENGDQRILNISDHLAADTGVSMCLERSVVASAAVLEMSCYTSR
jgi:hypothetical protein